MVAYSYKGRFVAPIRVGLGLPIRDEDRELGGYQPGQIIKPKMQTIRSIGRKRHARPGETVQHYHAQRSPKCFKIGDGKCASVSAIRIFVEAGRIIVNPNCDHEVVYSRAKQLDWFAGKDGFGDWSDMRAFWREEHGDLKKLGPFIGSLIEWMAACEKCSGTGRVWDAMSPEIAAFYGDEIKYAVQAGDDVKTVFRCEDCNGTGRRVTS